MYKEMVMKMGKKKYPVYIGLLFFYIVIFYWIYQIKRDQIPWLDEWSRQYVDSFPGTTFYDFFWTITHLGSKSFLLPFTIFVGVILWVLCKDWLIALFFSGGTLLSHLLNKGLKLMIERERPGILEGVNAEGFSFPSGHAMTGMVCYGLLMYFLVRNVSNKKVSLLLQVLFALLILSIGTSRYVIDVHYATDIVSGFTIGFTLLLILLYTFEKISEKRTKTINQS